MTYEVTILPRAQKRLASYDADLYDRILRAIRSLAENARPPGSRKLRGRDSWRLRIGDYRVLYLIDDQQRQITIIDLGHRREIYG